MGQRPFCPCGHQLDDEYPDTIYAFKSGKYRDLLDEIDDPLDFFKYREFDMWICKKCKGITIEYRDCDLSYYYPPGYGEVAWHREQNEMKWYNRLKRWVKRVIFRQKDDDCE